MSISNLISNLFSPRVVTTVNSRFSGQIRVMQTGGQKYIATGVLTQSGGRPVIKSLSKTYNLKPRTCLILGLAGGTVAGIISKAFPGIRIVGVEIDPVMIDLGKKYLGLDQIPNLEIIKADANSYIRNLNLNFDFVLVDLYLGDQIPQFVYSEKFLGQLGQLGKLVVINHLFYDPPKRQTAEELVKKLGKIFPSVRLHRVLTNLLIICE